MADRTDIEYITVWNDESKVNGFRVRTGRPGVLTGADRSMAGRIRRSLAKRGYRAHIDTMPGSVVVTRITKDTD